MNVTVTPEIVASILAKANPSYARCHNLNLNHADVAACKVGTVFVDRNGDYCVYTGLDGRNWKYPVMFTRVRDRATQKAVRSYLRDKVAKFSSK